MPENQLLKFILEMTSLLREGLENVDVPETRSALQSFRQQLEAIYENYEGDCPEGAESLQQEMQTGLTLFYDALDALDEFLEEPDSALLDEANELATQGTAHLDEANLVAEALAGSEPTYG